MNTCYNCLDRHVENGKGHRTALIYDSPLTGKIEMYSYHNLQRLVRMVAPGDQVFLLRLVVL